jgi:hypothetical protein
MKRESADAFDANGGTGKPHYAGIITSTVHFTLHLPLHNYQVRTNAHVAQPQADSVSTGKLFEEYVYILTLRVYAHYTYVKKLILIAISSLRELAKNLLDSGPNKTSPTSRRVRVLFNNSYIVDTTSAIHVWEHPWYPQFYVPHSALQNCNWTKQEDIKAQGGTGATLIHIKVPGPKGLKERSTDRAILFTSDESIAGRLAGLVRLEFGSMGECLISRQFTDAPVLIT